MNRGEPDELLGESGGVLPAGNIEGSELIAVAFEVDVPEASKGQPPLALLSKVFTCQIQLVISFSSFQL